MINTWDDIRGDSWDNLLLGNGFSVNIWNKYSYNSLYEYSKDKSIKPVLSNEITTIFDKMQTVNFEEVLKALAYAILVKESIGEDTKKCLDLYKTVQDNLFNTVHAVHISFSDVKKAEIAKELEAFNKIFTTCYDLILYWSSYNSLAGNGIADFFWNNYGLFNPSNTDVRGGKIGFYYLHGALHLQQDLAGSVSKIGYTSASLPLSEDFNYDGIKTKIPLYVSEGTSQYKLNKISSNSYLTFCYETFSKLTGSLLVVGHALDKNYDDHLVDAIKNNGNINRVAISVYSDLPDPDKEQFVKDLQARLYRRGLELFFFESNSYPLINQSVKA